uniref:Genome polyprotein n=1 Tax=Chaetodon aureofaciatus hepacivirus TaxID=2951535 RepID=A0A9Y1GC99_9FLAV|nr:MAG: polyprotein [Chaetodon aureofaciatus hepacivirus]
MVKKSAEPGKGTPQGAKNRGSTNTSKPKEKAGGHSKPKPKPKPKPSGSEGAKPEEPTKPSQPWLFGDSRTWLQDQAHGGAWPGIDTGLRWLVSAGGSGPAKTWRGDPRHNSRNLGRVIDGALGWVADVGMMIPVAWPILGYGGRFVCKVVRLAEDGVNAITGLGGLQLFIIMALCMARGVDARRCASSNEVSNVCEQRDIIACTADLCRHRAGCVVATDVCWALERPGVSVRPGSSEHLAGLNDHLDAFALGVYLCDIFGLGEYCGTLVIMWDLTDFLAPAVLEMNCSLLCIQNITTDSTVGTLFTWLGRELGMLGFLQDILRGLPTLLTALLSGANVGVVLTVIAYLVEGNWIKAVILLTLGSGLVSGDCYSEPVISKCNRTTDASVGYICWDPFPHIPTHRVVNGSLHWKFRHGSHCSSWTNFSASYWTIGGVLYSGLLRQTKKVHVVSGCCFGRQNNSCLCEKNGFCSWKKCHTGPLLGQGLMVATIIEPWNHQPNGSAGNKGHLVPLLCPPYNGSVLKRMPGTPVIRSGTTNYFLTGLVGSVWTFGRTQQELYNCPGWLWDVGSMDSGLITVGTNQRQVLSNPGLRGLGALGDHSILMFCLLHFMGARLSSCFYMLLVLFEAWASFPVNAGLAVTLATIPPSVPVLLAALIIAGGPPLWRPWILMFVVSCFDSLTGVLMGAAFTLVPGAAAHRDLAILHPDTALIFATFLVGLAVILQTPLIRVLRIRLRFMCMYALEVMFGAWDDADDPPASVALFVFVSLAGHFFPCAGCWALKVFGFWCGTEVLLYALANAAVFRLDKSTPYRCLELAARCGGWLGCFLCYFAAWLCTALKTPLYHHMGQIPDAAAPLLKKLRLAMDPVWMHPGDVKIIDDAARDYACGDLAEGYPVVARLGRTVMCGMPSEGVPYGYELAAPVFWTKDHNRGFLKTLTLSVLGKDEGYCEGSQICELKTIGRRCCGFGYDGALVTCLHGTRNHSLAAKLGSAPPRAVSGANDMVVYDLPAGMGCLSKCNCGATRGYLPLRDGRSISAELDDGEWWSLSVATPLSELKGRSGCPLVCKNGHAIGMFVVAAHRLRSVTAIQILPLKMPEAVAATTASTAPPVVRSDYRVCPYVAPTGSGKSTKMPHDYVLAGHQVLVLNPSVATTAAMPVYMKEQYGHNVNVYFGETSVTTGSNLTYATYGRFIANPDFFLKTDVIICDECHSLDDTTILGISTVLAEARNKVKLVVLATATPPGTPWGVHPNITETPLPKEGPIPFYGKAIDPTWYLEGRHLIFCATIAEVQKVTSQLKVKGLNAVGYWRGQPIESIPRTGKVVVVSTDALMTGYSGNFDSVTDCCAAVYTNADVDFLPTVSISVRTGAASSTTCLQRRGRTGRGAPGLYRPATTFHAAGGLVTDSMLASVFDTGAAWYYLSPDVVAARLDFYRQQPGLPSIAGIVDTWASFFESLWKVAKSAEANIACKAGYGYPLISAASAIVAKQHSLPLPPGDRWKAFKQPQAEKGFALVSFDGHSLADHLQHPEIVAAAAKLGYAQTSAILAVGVTVLALATITEACGSLVVGDLQKVLLTSHESKMPPLSPDVAEFEECVEFPAWLSYERAGEIYASAAAKFANAPVDSWSSWLIRQITLNTAQLTAAGFGLGGVALMPQSGVVGCFMLAVGTSMLSVSTLTLLKLAAAAAAMSTITGGGNCGILAGVTVGAAGTLAASSLMREIFSALCGLGSGMAAASVTFKIMTGQMPQQSELTDLLFCVFNPGAACMGALCAILLSKFCGDTSPQWMNRLLAMLAKGNVVPADFFVEARNCKETVATLLASLTPAALLRRLAAWCQTSKEEPCFSGLADSILRMLRSVFFFLKGTLPRLTLPLLGCSKPFTRVRGSGVIMSTCCCGARLTYKLENDHPVLTSCSSVQCWAYWAKGAVLGATSTFEGDVIVDTDPQEGDTFVFPTGLSGAMKCVWLQGKWLCIGSSCLEIEPVRTTSPISINGAPLRRADSTAKFDFFGPGAIVTLSGKRCILPCEVPAVTLEPTTRVWCCSIFQRSESKSGGVENTAYIRGSDEEASPDSSDYENQPPPVTTTVVVDLTSDESSSMDEIELDTPETPRVLSLQRQLSTQRAESMDEITEAPKKSLWAPGAKKALQTRELGARPKEPSTSIKRKVRLKPKPTGPPRASNCSSSYSWNGAPILTAVQAAVMMPCAVFSRKLGTYRGNVYSTDPKKIGERIAKVTIHRPDVVHPAFAAFCSKAVDNLKGKARELSMKEAAALTPSKSARSWTGLTASEVRDMTPKAVAGITDAYSSLNTPGVGSHKFVTIMPKVEWFAQTKPTQKPPRLILYPPLEMRVAEKMVLGEAAPMAAKKLLGEAYGFQYTPIQRAEKLVEMWKRRKKPLAFSADALCFDSQITPADMELEAAFYKKLLPESSHARVDTLTRDLYSDSPIKSISGVEVGHMNCRGTGTYTTSAGNTIICWAKMSCALEMLGKKADLLICGDDAVVITEAANTPSEDLQFLNRLEQLLGELGLVQGAKLTPSYSLERVESCSSHVGTAYSKMTGELVHYITRDPMTPFARAMVEDAKCNPLDKWLGAVLAFYPSLWASRVLTVAWLEALMDCVDIDPSTRFTTEYMGNSVTIQLQHLPRILANLHGRHVFTLHRHSLLEMSETSKALDFLGYGSMRTWKARSKKLRQRMMKHSLFTVYLAETLLWFVSGKPYSVSKLPRTAVHMDMETLPPYSNGEVEITPKLGCARLKALYTVGALVTLLLLVTF